MSDDVPPPPSEAPVSDRSQAHLSDRQATAADDRSKPLGKSPDEPSPHYSDRQATTDTRPQPDGGGKFGVYEIHFGVKTKEQEMRDASPHHR